MNNIYALSGISSGNFDNITSTNYETNISKQEILYLDGTRSNLQNQIDSISSGTGGYVTISGLTITLSNYVLNSALTTTLNNYVLSTTLNNYVLSTTLTPISNKVSNITTNGTATTFSLLM